MKSIHDALHQAANHSALYMEHELRTNAIRQGWHPSVAHGLHVGYVDGEFKVSVDADKHAAAHLHEYGDETTRPTAVIRKHGNNTSMAEKAFIRSLEKQLKGLL